MRILLVKLSSLGDVIQTIPVVRDLREALPHATVDWVVEEGFAPLLARVDGLARVVPTGLRRWRRQGLLSAASREQMVRWRAALRERAYDAVLDLQGLTKSALVARCARLAPGGFRAAFGNPSEECGYERPTRWLAQRAVPMPRRIHAVDRTRLMAARALGYEGAAGPLGHAPRYPLRVQPGGVPQRPAVLLAHGTTRDDNRWPRDCWLALARHLIEAGWQVWLPQADAAEGAWAQALAAELPPGAEVLPRMDLPVLMDRMATCGGVIGVDSGVSHLAVALGLPHVQIFSHDRAWRAGPQHQPHQRPVGGAQRPDEAAVWSAWCDVARLGHG